MLFSFIRLANEPHGCTRSDLLCVCRFVACVGLLRVCVYVCCVCCVRNILVSTFIRGLYSTMLCYVRLSLV